MTRSVEESTGASVVPRLRTLTTPVHLGDPSPGTDQRLQDEYDGVARYRDTNSHTRLWRTSRHQGFSLRRVGTGVLVGRGQTWEKGCRAPTTDGSEASGWVRPVYRRRAPPSSPPPGEGPPGTPVRLPVPEGWTSGVVFRLRLRDPRPVLGHSTLWSGNVAGVVRCFVKVKITGYPRSGSFVLTERILNGFRVSWSGGLRW